MYKSYVKRLLDILVSLLCLPLFLVTLLIFGPIIYYQDKGNIFYNAERLGKDGRIFKMYKFRSMKLNAPDLRNADGSTFNAEDDPRLIPIGRFIRKASIDELPQLLNVLKGDMSLVGPRPDLPEHIEQYVGEEVRKLEVRPGITGYNQAYFRNTVPWKERIQHDIFYVDHVSFGMDIQIIVKTALSILKRETVFITENKEQ